VVLLTLLASFLAFYGLGSLAFFRHTEADRTLIAWEMLQSGNFLIPTLLDSTILTKPPLFYWVVASALGLAGELSEWIARTPSALASVLLIILQLLIVRRTGLTSHFALTSALMVATGFQLHRLRVVAEIDMLYGLFSTLALYGIYFYVHENSKRALLLSYLALALAFLTKGPPTVAFFGVSLVALFAYERSLKRPLAFLFEQVPGIVLVAAILSTWLFSLADTVGWDTLRIHFEAEILNRAFEESSRDRPWYYYFTKLAGVLAPWVLFLPGLFVASFSEKEKQFLRFNLIVFVSTLLVLSLAEGKAGRYLFPVYVFGINLCALGTVGVARHGLRSVYFKTGVFLGALLAIAGLCIPLVITVPGVSKTALAVVGLLLIASGSFLLAASRERRNTRAFLAILSLCLVLKVAEVHVFNPFRNETRSVRENAETLNRLVPQGEPLYTIELFERWNLFYFIKEDRAAKRLTPQNVTKRTDSEPIYLLLNQRQETWRKEILEASAPETTQLAALKDRNERLILIRTTGAAVKQLELNEQFPVGATKPEDRK